MLMLSYPKSSTQILDMIKNLMVNLKVVNKNLKEDKNCYRKTIMKLKDLWI